MDLSQAAAKALRTHIALRYARAGRIEEAVTWYLESARFAMQSDLVLRAAAIGMSLQRIAPNDDRVRALSRELAKWGLPEPNESGSGNG